MKTICALLLTLVALSTTAQQKNINYEKRLAGIDKELNKLLADQHIAGFAVAVVKGNTIIYSKGFGYRDYEQKKPVTPNTLFAIGSSSKAFTSALIGLLEQEGKLKLDDPATMHLPQLRFKHDYMNSGVTIRDMMCHRTGLPRYDYSWYLFNTMNRDSLLQRVQHMEPTAQLRAMWQYNNYMFLAQGMIAERITGKTWEDNIRERFFQQLGMTRSNTSIAAMENDSDASLPYGLDDNWNIKKLDYFHIDAMGPAGSINSSVSEMANWVSTWISGGMFNGKEILPAGYIKEATSSQMAVAGAQPGEIKDVYFSNYGLGWFLNSYRGHYLVQHGGNIDGFSANVAFFPTDSIGIVVLTNQDGSPVPKIVRNIISDRLFGLEPIDWNGNAKKEMDDMRKRAEAAKKETADNRAANTQPSHPLADYAGLFGNPGYASFIVAVENDTLRLRFGGERYWLKHYHYDVFSVLEEGKTTDSRDFKINFATDFDGKIASVSMQLDDPSRPTAFDRQPMEVKLKTNELDKYVGEYDLEGMTAKIFLKGDILMLFVPGQPEYETISVGNHIFELTVAKGYSIQFEVDESEHATAVSFIQPNGTFKAKRK